VFFSLASFCSRRDGDFAMRSSESSTFVDQRLREAGKFVGLGTFGEMRSPIVRTRGISRQVPHLCFFISINI
jgi:hypothetical protein